jgi:RecA-family ATPase
VHEEGIRAKLGTAILRAQANLHDTTRESEEIASQLMQDVATVNASISSGMPIVEFDEMYATPEDSRKWVVPGCLRQNERMILTGREGGGKSTLVAQLCLSAAMGINSMALGYPSHEPLKVLMLDVENDRLQIKANMRKIYPALHEMTGNKPNMMWADVRNIDLSNSVEQAAFVRLCKTEQPDLIYAGSLYKLAPETDRVDGQFSAISRTVDLIRAETAASFILEAHAPHGMANDRAGMRPYGSSSWLRWPEFGFGMAQVGQDKSLVKMTTWRGARSDDRFWPAGLKRNGVLPWSPIMQDEWEVLGLD